jgi:hypothetical protein
VHLLSQASAVNMRCRAVLDWTEWLPAAQYIPNSHAPREGGGGGVGGGGMVRAFSNGVGVWGGCTSCPSPCRLHIRIISLFWY